MLPSNVWVPERKPSTSRQSKLHTEWRKKHDDACLNTAVKIALSEQTPYYLASRGSFEVRSSSTKRGGRGWGGEKSRTKIHKRFLAVAAASSASPAQDWAGLQAAESSFAAFNPFSVDCNNIRVRSNHVDAGVGKEEEETDRPENLFTKRGHWVAVHLNPVQVQL